MDRRGFISRLTAVAGGLTLMPAVASATQPIRFAAKSPAPPLTDVGSTLRTVTEVVQGEKELHWLAVEVLRHVRHHLPQPLTLAPRHDYGAHIGDVTTVGYVREGYDRISDYAILSHLDHIDLHPVGPERLYSDAEVVRVGDYILQRLKEQQSRAMGVLELPMQVGGKWPVISDQMSGLSFRVGADWYNPDPYYHPHPDDPDMTSCSCLWFIHGR